MFSDRDSSPEERFQLECTSHHFEGGRDAAQDAAEREREIRAERQHGERQKRDGSCTGLRRRWLPERTERSLSIAQRERL